MLLARGADISTTDKDPAGDEWTVLHHAANRGSLKRLKWAVEEGCPVDCMSRSGLTPLMLATKHGHMRLMLHLLMNKANFDKQDDDGASALHFAARHGSVASVKLLLVAGASNKCHDQSSKTPIDYAAEAKRLKHLDALRVYTPKHVSETEYVDFAGRHFGIDIFEGFETGSQFTTDSSVLTPMPNDFGLDMNNDSFVPSEATAEDGESFNSRTVALQGRQRGKRASGVSREEHIAQVQAEAGAIRREVAKLEAEYEETKRGGGG